MKYFQLSLIVLVSLVVLSSYAEEEKRNPMKADDLPEYNEVRDPFWRYPYVRKIVVKVDPTLPKEDLPPAKFVPKWPKLKPKIITKSSKGYFAVIEGVRGMVVEGAKIVLTVDDVVYTWRVDKISKKGLAYTQLDAKPAK
jgi:hypothetical protein